MPLEFIEYIISGEKSHQGSDKLKRRSSQYSNKENYFVTEYLADAINIALNMNQPLLLKGEPGTGNYRKFLFMERFN